MKITGATAFSAATTIRAAGDSVLVDRTARSAIAAAILFGFAGASNAVQPPDVVQTDGFGNTAMGGGALYSLTPQYEGKFTDQLGSWNTAAGEGALFHDTTGDNNTAFGAYALNSSTTAYSNTAVGAYALTNNTTGEVNTAVGDYALTDNNTGGANAAFGSGALYSNTSGNSNTATGAQTLTLNTTGNNNTALGSVALAQNTTGSNNYASGTNSLYSNTIGNLNTASGENSLYSNVYGSSNSAFGHSALKDSTGTNNLGLGANGGYNVTSGSNNVEIANQGLAGDNGVIRIGAPSTQVATFIAGIENSKVTGAAVYVTSSGQLGVLASSERYKTAVSPMGRTTENLQQLRPVSFHLKSDPNGEVQYGLIAEEVAKVYPELVIRDAAGAVQGVRYDELAPMLLNEVQKQAAEMRDLKSQLANMEAALAEMHSKDQRVAQR